VRTAANQVNGVEVLETIARPQVQHLAQVVGQIERRTAINAVAIFPIGRGRHVFEANPTFDIVDADFAQLPQGQVAITGMSLGPIDIAVWCVTGTSTYSVLMP
jgi:hypothetical protein